MPENGTQDNPTEQTKNHPEETKRKRLRPVWLTDVILVYICGGLVIVLLACGAALLNSHPKPVVLAWTTMLAAIIFLGLAPDFGSLIIERNKPRTRFRNGFLISYAWYLQYSVYHFGCMRFAKKNANHHRT